jgi:predicted RNA-binding Zn ribbon-like protein
VDAVLVGGNLALDFIGTLMERRSSRVEQLRAPRDLASWLVAAGVLDRAPATDDADLTEGLELRESLFRVIEALLDGTPLPLRDLARVNRAASVPTPVDRVDRAGRRRRTGDVPAALSAIARDGLELFDLRDGSVLKWCADADCTHPFLDRSRGHRRRWCEMAACGDRAKAAAYRARRRASPAR